MSVFAVHPLGDIDVSAATAYGEVEYINTRYIYADEVEDEHIPANVLARLEKAVDRFDPDHDYMLIAGDHLQIVTLSALLANRWGRFRALRFDRKASGYLCVCVECQDVVATSLS